MVQELVQIHTKKNERVFLGPLFIFLTAFMQFCLVAFAC